MTPLRRITRKCKEAALEEFERLNETHRLQPLPDEVLAELERILAAAEREMEGVT